MIYGIVVYKTVYEVQLQAFIEFRSVITSIALFWDELLCYSVPHRTVMIKLDFFGLEI